MTSVFGLIFDQGTFRLRERLLSSDLAQYIPQYIVFSGRQVNVGLGHGSVAVLLPGFAVSWYDTKTRE